MELDTDRRKGNKGKAAEQSVPVYINKRRCIPSVPNANGRLMADRHEGPQVGGNRGVAGTSPPSSQESTRSASQRGSLELHNVRIRFPLRAVRKCKSISTKCFWQKVLFQARMLSLPAFPTILLPGENEIGKSCPGSQEARKLLFKIALPPSKPFPHTQNNPMDYSQKALLLMSSSFPSISIYAQMILCLIFTTLEL